MSDKDKSEQIPVINTPAMAIPHQSTIRENSPFRHPVCFHDGTPCHPASPGSLRTLHLPHDDEAHAALKHHKRMYDFM